MQEHCLFCGASEASFIHPDYNSKWVRIVLTPCTDKYVAMC